MSNPIFVEESEIEEIETGGAQSAGPTMGNVTGAVVEAVREGARKLSGAQQVGQDISKAASAVGREALSVVAGFNRGLTQLLGLPSDIINAGLRMVDLPEAMGGSRDWESLFNQIGIETKSNPQTVAGKFAARIAEEAGVSVAGLTGLAGAQRLARATQTVVNEAIRNPSAFISREVGTVVGAGVGGQAVASAREATGRPEDPISEAAGTIAGAVAGSRVGNIEPGRVGLTTASGNRGREGIVGRALVEAATARDTPQGLVRPNAEQLIKDIDEGVSSITEAIPGVRPSTAQASGNRGLAAIEGGMGNPDIDSAGRVSDRGLANQRAAIEAVTPPGGVGPRVAPQDNGRTIRAELEASEKEARTKLQEIENNLPITAPVDPSRLNAMLVAERKGMGLGERARMNDYFPKPLQDFMRIARSQKATRGRLTFDDIRPLREDAQRELEALKRQGNPRPEAVQRLEAFIGQIDSMLGESYQNFLRARDDFNNTFRNTRTSESAPRSGVPDAEVPGVFVGPKAEQPASFSDLVRALGNRRDAVEAAKNQIHYNFLDRVAPLGRNQERTFNPSAFAQYIQDPNNASLIKAAYGVDHWNQLNRVSEALGRLDITRSTPPRQGSNLQSLGPSMNRVEQVVRRPLDPYSTSGLVRTPIIFLGRAIYGRSDKEVARIFERAMADPEFAKVLLRRVGEREFERVAPRFGLRPISATAVTEAENNEPR